MKNHKITSPTGSDYRKPWQLLQKYTFHKLLAKRYLALLSGLLLSLTFLLFLLFLLLNYLFPLSTAKLRPATAAIVKTADQQIARTFLSPDGFWRLAMEPQQITPQIRHCLLFFEDRYFYLHFGCNPLSILRAFWQNIWRPKKIGASTITMQVARLMEQRPRTFGTKLLEAFRALQIEWYFHKDEILLFYLNMAPYGGNIEGFRTAALAYFNKEPQELSLAEISLLVQVPKNPNHNRPDRLKNPMAQKNKFLEKIQKQALFTPEMIKRASLETLTIIKPTHKIYAPHFTEHPYLKNLARTMTKTTTQTKQTEINTSINLELQNMAEKILQKNIAIQARKGIKNGAIVILHNPSMSIEAYVGSENFFAANNEGQNDGLRMKRSPGSALKPFIYALALEQGIISPKQQLLDIPINLNGYSPKNYDGYYRGLVSAATALQLSLNTPAVQLNESLDNDLSLYEFLQKAQISSITRHKSHYGAAIALGGVEISLLELTHLYTIFARQGQLHPLNFTIDQKSSTKPLNLLSPESAWLIANILQEAPRQHLNAYWDSNPQNAIIAFKTGTSAQRSDFLAIGFNSAYTVGVWFGNFNGKKANYGSGIDTAAPTLLEIFNQLQRHQVASPIQKPDSIISQEICAEPLKRAREACRHLVTDDIFSRQKLTDGCQLLKAEQFQFLLQEGLYQATEIKELCRLPLNIPPKISYPPQKQNTIFYSRLLPLQYQKNRFTCQSYQENPEVYLFIDGEFYKKTLSGQSEFINLDYGHHVLGCLDQSSGYSFVKVEVKN